MIAASLPSQDTPYPAAPPPNSAALPLLRQMQEALHDLGQPLTSIALVVELLVVEPDPEVRQTMLTAAREECSRAMNDLNVLRNHTANLLHLATLTDEENA